MNPFKLALREIKFRRVNFLLGLGSVIIAVATLSGSVTLLRMHDLRTQKILEEKSAETQQLMAKLKDEMRVAMLKLGLNLVILPADQNVADWYLDGGAQSYMPESYVEKLADSGVITVRHFLPNLQHRVKWPEMGRQIVLIGTRGEVPNLHKGQKDPIVQPVPDGTIVLGWELHRSLGLEVEDRVRLMDRDFRVHRCHEERGNQDDVTAWIPLEDAQQLLDKSGKINSIIALQCICKGPDFSTVRNDILSVLPDTQVLEMGTERRLARSEARMSVGKKAKETLAKESEHRTQIRAEKELVASVLVAVVLVASCVWIGFLTLSNINQRTGEIGILKALGYRSVKVLMLFVYRALFTAVPAAVIGMLLGVFVGATFSIRIDNMAFENLDFTELVTLQLLLLVFIAAPVLTVISSAVPAMAASHRDPALMIRKEAA